MQTLNTEETSTTNTCQEENFAPKVEFGPTTQIQNLPTDNIDRQKTPETPGVWQLITLPIENSEETVAAKSGTIQNKELPTIGSDQGKAHTISDLNGGLICMTDKDRPRKHAVLMTDAAREEFINCLIPIVRRSHNIYGEVSASTIETLLDTKEAILKFEITNLIDQFIVAELEKLWGNKQARMSIEEENCSEDKRTTTTIGSSQYQYGSLLNSFNWRLDIEMYYGRPTLNNPAFQRISEMHQIASLVEESEGFNYSVTSTPTADTSRESCRERIQAMKLLTSGRNQH